MSIEHIPAPFYPFKLRACRTRPLVDLTEPPSREQVPAEGLYDVEGDKVLKRTDRRCSCSRPKMHLTDAQNEDDETGEKEKNCAETACSDWEP